MSWCKIVLFFVGVVRSAWIDGLNPNTRIDDVYITDNEMIRCDRSAMKITSGLNRKKQNVAGVLG